VACEVSPKHNPERSPGQNRALLTANRVQNTAVVAAQEAAYGDIRAEIDAVLAVRVNGGSDYHDPYAADSCGVESASCP
jgi:hypothetical protein